MGWREELKLADVDDETEIEVACRACKKFRYFFAQELKSQGRLRHMFMIEVQAALPCMDKLCPGAQRLAILHDDKNEGFIGGMP